MKKKVYLLIILQFIGAILSSYLIYDASVFIIGGNSIGFSLITNIYVYIIVYEKGSKFCNITKLMPFLLSLINVIDIVGVFISFIDYSIILKSVLSITSIILLLFKNKINNYEFIKKID